MTRPKCKNCPDAIPIEGEPGKVRCPFQEQNKEWYWKKDLEHECLISERTKELLKLNPEDRGEHRLFILINDKFKGDLVSAMKWAGKALVQYYREVLECAVDPDPDEELEFFPDSFYGDIPEIVYLWYPEEDFKSWSRCHWNFRNNGLKYIPSSEAEDENRQYMAVVLWEDEIYKQNNYDYCDWDWGIEYALECIEKLERIK